MTPQTEQTILNIFGLLLMVAYIVCALLMNRAPNAPPEVEAMEPEDDEADDQYTYRTDPVRGAIAGAWARGRE
jgi:hypothetical protein